MAIMNDGFNTTITFPGAGVTFVEKEVTPPPLEGGGAINITAMRNVSWRTKAPKYLIELGAMALKARYDPVVYAAGQIRAQINKNQNTILVFPTLTNAPNRTIAFYAFLNKFAPEKNAEGDEPLADIEIIPTMQNAGVEVDLITT